MKKSSILSEILGMLPSIHDNHAPGTPLYLFLKKIVRLEVERLFGEDENEVFLPPFGTIVFPYHSMGAVDSLNLFDIDELIIFSFYWRNRKRYSQVLDIGANIGLHSIFMSRCGFDVSCYEPDPIHFELLQRNLVLNDLSNIRANNLAMSSQDGEVEFVRVLGNTTGSHIAGSKPNPYGDLERFPVKLTVMQPLLKTADLIKMDIEGHEKEVILSTAPDDWLNTDAFIEIENKENGAAVYDFFLKSPIRLFSQKNNWRQVRSAGDMPNSYREGSLFLTSKENMPWS